VNGDDRIRDLEDELARVRDEKDALDGQYRGLLGKLTMMRKSLGDKLREDAVC
jgi:predicted  nucleic acid-binding Zn-ribbon protein